VAVEVVELLEVVEVEVGDDELHVVFEQVAGAALHGAPVGQAGERVDLGEGLGAGEDALHADAIAGLAGDEFQLGGELLAG